MVFDMRIDNNGVMIFTKNDVIIRHLIIFSEKLLDEKVNDWFRDFLQQNKDVDMGSEEDIKNTICQCLIDKFNFNDDDFGVIMLNINSIDGDRGFFNYTITHQTKDNKTINFDNYNGYWYTATKQGAEYHLVLFDYGDFYCLGNVFPLATFFVGMAKRESKKVSNGDTKD